MIDQNYDTHERV